MAKAANTKKKTDTTITLASLRRKESRKANPLMQRQYSEVETDGGNTVIIQKLTVNERDACSQNLVEGDDAPSPFEQIVANATAASIVAVNGRKVSMTGDDVKEMTDGFNEIWQEVTRVSYPDLNDARKSVPTEQSSEGDAE
jgi:hypothetical protein